MKSQKLAFFGILSAIIILMAFTPIGYLRVGVVEITFLMIPVIIGAAAYGPLFGAGLGLVFGVTSFAQCFGMSAFGTLLFSLNPWFAGIGTIVPRVLFGLVTGFIYEGLSKTKIKPVLCDGITMLSGTIFHTIVFMVFFMLMFGKTEEVQSFGDGFFGIIWAMVGVNAIVEWVVCATIGTAILNGARYFIKRIRAKRQSQNS